MSEPCVEWFVERIRIQLREIDNLVNGQVMTNSMREIIKFDTNEIEINLHTIVRKLKNDCKNN